MRQILFCAVLFVALSFGYSSAFGAQLTGGQTTNAPIKVTKPKPSKKVKLKPLKPLSEKDIQNANKKALKATSTKSIQKANQKIFKEQAKGIKRANGKSAKANKALQKAHTKALREQEKQARAEAQKKKLQ